ncbi:relaxase/mobilization nuclease domain-containing protein [Chryseobacterium gotjawalense]|uniref:Relaxase/mobilization nuclease domain-containing protein n=1 Tax=Chryseobacterium gotjawalense TaxID=3042315 RepID=A0ABY8RD95_9FLAO|nr:relaxase/mobilization nuclease domain-containing protein [Chryseobacterium sp. wdc7]WHF51943.1 relaxase/mobilization nuclease domain-containing protein [Chryseobacterium sp. wdc7]
MIIKIMAAAGSSFPGVNYNDKKIDKGSGELMLMKNFPSFINKSSKKEQVRDYLRAISVGNKKVLKPQFHAMISTKFQEHSKEELTEIAENFMDEMGYGKQPFTVVFHNDTDNNHVHLVTTRVDKTTGKKINDSYEKLKSQKALAQVMEKIYGINENEKLNKLLNYKIGSLSQLETLLERSGYKMVKNKGDENTLDILKNGVKQKTINGNQIIFDNQKNDNRKNQIKAILIKYKEIYSNKVFKVEDNRRQESMLPDEKFAHRENYSKMKTEFESELQKKLKDVFGIDVIFHQKDDLKPFGYTLIDHKSGKVYKGSEVLKMNELIEFTSYKIDKKLFEILKDYNIPNLESKKILLEFLNKKYPEAEIKEFMLFENRGKKDLETYRKVQFEVKDFIRNYKNTNDEKKDISILKSEDGNRYAIHTRFHYIEELRLLLGENEYQRYFNAEGVFNMEIENRNQNNKKTEIIKAVDEILFELGKSTTTAKDPAENELKKKRKRRK